MSIPWLRRPKKQGIIYAIDEDGNIMREFVFHSHCYRVLRLKKPMFERYLKSGEWFYIDKDVKKVNL